MKRTLLASVAALLAGSGIALGQTTPVPPPMEKAAVPSALPAAPESQPIPAGVSFFDAPSDGSRIWGSTEALLWWAKSAKVPVVTTGDPTTAAAAGLPLGAFGTPGTVPLNSGRQEFDAMTGFQGSFGTWLDPEAGIGFEVGGFVTGTTSARFSVASNAAGSPAILIPAIGTPPLFPAFTESSQPFAVPGAMAGGITINSSLHAWGTEANGVYGASNSDAFRLKLLSGFRYIDLTELLDMYDATSFIGVPGLNYIFHDRFETRNQIYAGQIGAQAEMNFGRFYVNATGKLGFGFDHESVNIQGNTTIVTPPGAFPFPPPVMPVNAGAFFALPSNIGRQTHDDFVFVPELRLEAGMNLTRNLRIFAGYDILYMSSVVRPGDQIDRTINGTQGFGSPLIGPVRPAPLFNTSDFWMQGVNAGIEFRF